MLLSGCGGTSIDSTSPETGSTLSGNTSEKLRLSVTGPTSLPLSYRYNWVVDVYNTSNNRTRNTFENSGKTYDYVVPTFNDSTLYVEITCQLQKYVKLNIINSYWETVDSRMWEIKQRQQHLPPTWAGDMFIRNSNDLVDLEEITVIEGTLIIDNISFDTLDFLSRITEIGGGVVISDNANVNTTADFGLGNLQSIGGALLVLRNESLTSLSELINLQSLGGDLVISNNALTSLAGLENIQSIAGDIRLTSNNDLISIQELTNINSIDNLTITDNIGLTSLLGLNNLHTIAGDLTLHDIDNITSLVALSNLHSLGGSLSVRFNDSLTSLSGA